MQVVELQGANHLNKGGQLMLIATSEHMASAFPSVDLGLSLRGSDWALRERDGLKHIIYLERERFPGMNRLIGAGLSLIPTAMRRSRNLVRESEILAVLDASGFRYSDQWGPNMLETNADRAVRLSRIGKPVVFLPQAFGPFESERAKSAAKRLIDSGTLVFARDRVSFEHIRSVVGDAPQLRLGPDFTNLVDPSTESDLTVPERSLMVVPNTRMLDKMGGHVADGYVPFLIDLCVYGAEKGFNPVILVHDAEEDIALGRIIKRECPVEVTMLFDEDPRRLKGYLAKASAIVSSRFHALVGALSCATPSIAVGWSHKYDELMADYGFKNLSLRISDKDAIFAILDQWSDETTRDGVRRQLLRNASIQKVLARKMWEEVDAAIAPVIRAVS